MSVAFESCSVHWSIGEIFGHGRSRSEGFPSATGWLWVGYMLWSFSFVSFRFEVYAAMDSYKMIGVILNSK
jgi:hypothetical protein